MASNPNSPFSTVPISDSLDEFLPAQGTGFSNGVIKRRELLELVKRLELVNPERTMGYSFLWY